MVNSFDVAGQRIHKHVSSTAHAQMKNQTPVMSNSTHPVVELQQQFGNRYVMRQLADRSHFNTNRSSIQRNGSANSSNNAKPKSANLATTKPPLKEATVPIPQQHPVKSSPPIVGGDGQTAVAPEQAKIRIPINFDYHLLPPELKVRLLDEFSITTKVTETKLQWQHNKLKLGLSYEHGEALSAQGSYGSDFGTLSGKASYKPDKSSARFDLGFEQGKFRADAYGTTGGEYGVGLSYGMKPLPNPDKFEESVRKGEQSARNILNNLPEATDLTKLPAVLKTHKKDFEQIGKAVSPIVDLAERDTSHIDWGFYLRFSKGPYQPSELYRPYFQQFEGQDEYKVEGGVGVRF